MKNLITILLIIFAINSFAQTDNLKQTEQYFEFTAVRKGLFEKGYGFTIAITFGQKYLSADSVIRNKTIEQIQSFSKLEDVLEFMNAMGWKLVTAYANSHDHYYTYFYIMKKEIQQN